MNEQERFAWIQLALTPYIGSESFLTLLHHFGSAQAALAASANEISTLLSRNKQAVQAWLNHDKRALSEASAEAALKWALQDGCRLMLLQDEDFPLMLTEGITPPVLLFLRGNVSLLNQSSIAIVGSRHATPQAMRITRDFAYALSMQNITVVSGMAAGIDTAAHQGALSAKCNTIAVWGTGINRVYPPSNKNLAHELVEKGLVVSEFPLDTRPLAGNFPRRNRIIAALSHATLVVEAALESGSLITAKLAAEMGREVMAVPGSIDNPHSKGCHKLIKDGAKLVECLDDIVQECPSLLQNTFVPSYFTKTVNSKVYQNAIVIEENKVFPKIDKPQEKTENMPLWTAMGYDPIHPDALAQQLNLSASDVYAQLMEWELVGRVAVVAGGRYQRILNEHKNINLRNVHD